MLARINKKGEGLATNKLIIIIICMVVLAAVLIFMFKGSINNWIQNLPGYGSQEDKELNVTEDRPGVSSYETVGKVFFNEPRSTFNVWTRWIYNWAVRGPEDYARVYIKNEKTDILWYYDSGDNPKNGPLELDEKGNEGVGSVNNGVISILISQWDDASERAGYNIPSIEKLVLIDGAKIVGNEIRKDKPLAGK